jgi:multicomponent Na+:H+ antiporter subunit G
MTLAINLVGGVLIALGVALVVLAGIGIVRFTDVYSRMSAVTKAATLGVAFVLAGVLVLEFTWVNALKLTIAIALQLATAPVGAFAMGRAAYRARTPLSPLTRYDELRDPGELGPAD